VCLLWYKLPYGQRNYLWEWFRVRFRRVPSFLTASSRLRLGEFDGPGSLINNITTMGRARTETRKRKREDNTLCEEGKIRKEAREHKREMSQAYLVIRELHPQGHPCWRYQQGSATTQHVADIFRIADIPYKYEISENWWTPNKSIQNR